MASAKSDFLTAFTATTLVGATKAFSSPNTTTEAVTATAHGKETGFGPVRLATSNTLPAGLALSTNYWLIVVDANTVKFASSEANALAGTAVNITDAGTGTFSMQCSMQTIADNMEDCLTNVLTFPGNRTADPDTNVSKFWQAAASATFA